MLLASVTAVATFSQCRNKFPFQFHRPTQSLSRGISLFQYLTPSLYRSHVPIRHASLSLSLYLSTDQFLLQLRNQYQFRFLTRFLTPCPNLSMSLYLSLFQYPFHTQLLYQTPFQYMSVPRHLTLVLWKFWRWNINDPCTRRPSTWQRVWKWSMERFIRCSCLW